LRAAGQWGGGIHGRTVQQNRIAKIFAIDLSGMAHHVPFNPVQSQPSANIQKKKNAKSDFEKIAMKGTQYLSVLNIK